MLEKLRQKLKRAESKEKALIACSVLVTALLSVWALSSPQNKDSGDQNIELGLTIPKGFSIVPLDLSNAQGLTGIISKTGVIDVFSNSQRLPLIENLRVLKISAGEGPAFGALIPAEFLGEIQDRLSKPGLKGVLKPTQSGPTKLHFPVKGQPLVREITIQEDL